ncbi:spindle and centriole-associated protein 1 isoform X1 [Osmerus mordax]|uniref:spindle and centriole-associated protein 1 isoform X1 n=2 Tax=Osmerus mordax TaxID=8014 RepID=UPI003510703B
MSFVRIGRSVPGQGKRPTVRSKKTSAPNKEWVSTVNDLSVHKLTPEEVSRRHEMHRSQNRAVAKWELKERALRRRRKHTHPLDRGSISIIREVFSEHLQLQDVLARSDKAMAVVKDLFGDAPLRQTGFPSVTMAPDCGSDADLPVLQRPDPPTQLSLLSQSLMDTQALNEVEHLEDGDDHEEADPSSSFSSQSNMDTHSCRVNQRKGKAKPHRARGPQQQKTCQATPGQQGAVDNVAQTPCTSGAAAGQAALNATVAVQRLRTKRSQMEPSERGEPSVLVTQVLNADHPLTLSGKKVRSSRANRGRSAEASVLDGSNISSLSGNQSSLGLLQGLLAQVESELDGLGPAERPVSGAPGPRPQPSSHSLTGFSVALVSSLGRMASLLRQREEEARREARERSRLAEAVKEQRGLIDALTAETLALREESAALQAAVQHRTQELEHTVDTVVLALGGLGLLGGGQGLLGGDMSSEAAAPDSGTLGCDRGPHDAVRETAVHPAVLLSPPRQRDSRQHSTVVRSLSLHQQTSRPAPTLSPAPSLCSLPRPSTASPTDHTLEEPNILSQDAMLAQIAELTRQNALIKTQLVQSRGHGSGHRSPRNHANRRGSGSSSAGREMPLSGPERQAPAPSTGRATPQMDAERDRGPTPSRAELQLSQQTVESDRPCVSSMEQRLLELNQQSAAARNRLLELIEQQQQSISARGSPSVSPSVSPIPPHSLSTATASGRTPELSVSLPEQDPSPDCSGDRRRTGSAVSPQSVGTDSRGAVTRGGGVRGEGWFALSTHVR